MPKPQKQSLAVGGIQLNVFSPVLDPGKAMSRVAVLFLLHGRLFKADSLETTAANLVEKSEDRRRSTSDVAALDLVVITFDLRNHGSRMINPQGNQQWSRKVNENNPQHAVDMFSIISGTYRDISFLIDFLPSYLFPHGEQAVERWMLAGISLGGHATWYALQHEPRLSVGIPIVGCPDYLALMHNRAKASGLRFGPPILPDSLLELIRRESPVSTLVTGKSPFFGKKILVLAGGKDDLVPWVFSESFVERIEVGEEGVKKVIVYPDIGHVFTASMEEDLASFVWEEGCCVVATAY
ncbi:alpha/beta-hydrolase [Thelephora ganbajun]|uniref:Alpha/beta-hydrolase n=1 Tax=Thelephora ganbajun TaxID=370292 RepID=A0ACB6ZM71_THEGA|nr:alpha/beta-hydrolase [Thelephora ganbajun]